jgi:predicted nucleic acid-binding protein
MRKILVNSNYLIDYLRGKIYTKKLIDSVKKRELEASISVITLFELYCGALLLSNSIKRLEEVELLIQWFDIIDINKKVIYIASKIFVDLKRKGRLIDIRDILIASCAIQRDLEFLTQNKAHFKDIKGLRINKNG